MRIKVRDMNLITSQRVFVGPYIPSLVTSSSLCALTIAQARRSARSSATTTICWLADSCRSRSTSRAPVWQNCYCTGASSFYPGLWKAVGARKHVVEFLRQCCVKAKGALHNILKSTSEGQGCVIYYSEIH